MKSYDLIVIGTGSAMNIVDPMFRDNPNMKIAVIDKDEPGGICLTRGCIPSKILLYPAELVRLTEKAREFGIATEIASIDFAQIMTRMRSLIDKDIDSIRRGLSSSENIDYFHEPAEFVSPYTLKVGGGTITSKLIFLCIGSQTIIPPVKGLAEAGFLTSDEALKLKKLPKSVAIVGGGYIAAELGHFLAAMGSRVTIVGRNPQFIPEEEPEVSEVLRRELGRHMTILTNKEVREARTSGGLKRLVASDRKSGKTEEIAAEEILVATGRGPTSGILHPERGGVETDEHGWIKVDEYLQTSQPGIWAIGDADGRFMFKHVANYESEVVYYNAVLKQKVKVDYHAVPHAVFTYPEAAGVGMKENEAMEKFGRQGVLIGFYKYEDTAKGEAMAAKDYFVKVILEKQTERILGAHIAGPYASMLIQELVNAMYTGDQGPRDLRRSMYIHPALNEVVQRALTSVYEVEEYHHMLSHQHEEE
ncbi:MAG TPA: dihydrolipoyl dehydrogenase [Nitrososphaerales archaeon]|nr:dihydrolipoyl dehydrogenase [Nitrososphaerales archaeon]